MRRIILAPDGTRPNTPNLPSLPIEESVWEAGYPLVVDERETGILQAFWKHYYGASAEMVISGPALTAFRQDIMAIAPGCAGEPAVLDFLLDLARMCARARREKSSLHVIAD